MQGGSWLASRGGAACNLLGTGGGLPPGAKIEVVGGVPDKQNQIIWSKIRVLRL